MLSLEELDALETLLARTGMTLPERLWAIGVLTREKTIARVLETPRGERKDATPKPETTPQE